LRLACGLAYVEVVDGVPPPPPPGARGRNAGESIDNTLADIVAAFSFCSLSALRLHPPFNPRINLEGMELIP